MTVDDEKENVDAARNEHHECKKRSKTLSVMMNHHVTTADNMNAKASDNADTENVEAARNELHESKTRRKTFPVMINHHVITADKMNMEAVNNNETENVENEINDHEIRADKMNEEAADDTETWPWKDDNIEQEEDFSTEVVDNLEIWPWKVTDTGRREESKKERKFKRSNAIKSELKNAGINIRSVNDELNNIMQVQSLVELESNRYGGNYQNKAESTNNKARGKTMDKTKEEIMYCT